MNYTLCVLGLVNVLGAGLSFVVHGGAIAPQLHAVLNALIR
jgi:hypothetical protein